MNTKDIIARALALSRSGGGGGGGREIVSVTFLSSDKGDTAGIPGATDTYKILYSDGTYDVFRIYNGANGESPLLRNSGTTIDVSYDNGVTWSILIELSEISGVNQYADTASYQAGQIVYYTIGQVYQAALDFDACTDYDTAKENFDADVASGNLIPLVKPLQNSFIDDLFDQIDP